MFDLFSGMYSVNLRAPEIYDLNQLEGYMNHLRASDPVRAIQVYFDRMIHSFNRNRYSAESTFWREYAAARLEEKRS